MTTSLQRLRLALDLHGTDLLLVGDVFAEGGRYVQAEVHRPDSASWTWLTWDDQYDRLEREWHARFGALTEGQFGGDGLCHVRGGGGECDLPVGHGSGSKVHREMRDGKLWASWRSILSEDECVCHVRQCAVHPEQTRRVTS